MEKNYGSRKVLLCIVALFVMIVSFPVLARAEDSFTDTGIKMGDNISVWLNADGTVAKLVGSGEMTDYVSPFSDVNEGGKESLASVGKIIIEDGITNIGSGSFAYISGSKEFVLPESLNVIKDRAFYGLGVWNAEINLPNSLLEIGNGSLNEMYITNDKFPQNLKQIGLGAFEGCKFKCDLELPETLEEVGRGAFVGVNVDNVSWPASIPVIKDSMFDMSQLRRVKIGEGVTEIEDCAFGDCAQLESVELPTTLEKIHVSCFAGCSSLKDIDLSNISNLEGSAFYGCSNLKTATFGKNIKYIGDSIFNNCYNLKIIGYSGTKAEEYANRYSIPFEGFDRIVTFMSDYNIIEKQSVLVGESAIAPDLSKEGYTYHWNRDLSNVTENMTVTAIWEKIRYTVKFVYGGKVISNQRIYHGEDANAPVVISGGSSCITWDKDFTNIKSDLTITGTLHGQTVNPPVIVTPTPTVTPEPIEKYKVTFIDRGKIRKTEMIEKGGTANSPELYRYGYELSWDADYSNVTKDLSVEAIWTIINPDQVEGLELAAKKQSIALSWDEAEYASKYQISRKAANENKYEVIGLSGKTAYNDYDVEAGMGYYYKVTAMRSVGGKKYYGKESKVVSALVPLNLPTNMSIKRVSKVSKSTTAQLTMNISKNATGYYIYCYDRKASKNLLAYKIEGKKVYSYNKATRKYKQIGTTTIKGTKLTCKLTKIDLNKYSSYGYRVRAYSRLSGFKTQQTPVSGKFYLKR